MIDFDELRKEVYNRLVEENTGHDYSHVMRVFKNSILIAQSEQGVDMDALKAAALLHDIAFSEKFEGEYAKRSEEIASEMLKEKYFSDEKLQKILGIIRNHNIWVNYRMDVDIETKILRDSSRLDYLGYTGIIRAIAHASHTKKNPMTAVQETVEIGSKFETRKGKELSKNRLQITKDFINGLEQDY